MPPCPQKSYVEILTEPHDLKMWLWFGDRIFAKTIKLKMRSLGLVLTQYNWCPIRSKHRGFGRRYTQREDTEGHWLSASQ